MTARPRARMPQAVSAALAEARQRKAYDARPPYQRNDYLRWIAEAKKDETKKARSDQMIAELKAGDRYMGMAWNGGDDGSPG